MYAVVRHYHFKKEESEKIDQLVQDLLMPLLKKAQGFISYYWLDTGEGEGASLSVFEHKAGADESIQIAAEFVKEHLADFVMQKTEVIEGPVKAHS
jgi:hypothetical protein